MAEMNHFNTSNSKMPLDINWGLLLDDSVDDRPPDIVITPAEKSKGRGGDLQQPEMEEEDPEYRMKTDGELEGLRVRTKSNILMLGPKLSDKGEKLKATLRRCEAEVERRKRNRLCKGSTTRYKETLQLSNESDDGVSCGKKKSDQKSSASPNFTKLFSQKLDEDKTSRTVNAFQGELSFFKPFQGKKMKQSCQHLSSRSKQFRCSTSFKKDSEKQRSSNADKKVSHSATSSSSRNMSSSSLKANAPINQPSRKLKHTHVSSVYHLVDEEEPLEENMDDWAHAPQNLPPKKLKPKHVSAYCLVDEEPLSENDDDWSHAPHTHSPPSRKSRPKDRSAYEEPVAEILDDCMQDVIVYYPSRDDHDSVEVNYRDMTCLAPQAYLSSTIMNFYIRYLQEMTSSENMMDNFHFFNTYFYNKLQKLSYKEDSFLKFRKWWKGVNIFNKPYILLPIHDKVHWSLCIICFPTKKNELGPIVLHLDSLGLHDSRSIFKNIKRFVKEEWRYLKNSEENLNLKITDEIWENLDSRMDDRRISVPQQRNEYDCGLFVLYYMERFIKEAPERFKEKDLSMFGKQWFMPQEASNLRRRISNLLVQQFKIAKQKETISSSV
ncbi:unnamed protein product [Lactuca saligna]|uniref:Ubiquitin-like protease family profile domain-containing protein n=1 Tax=Lactuca saligna TaxID=75948 RepID=A0AA36ENT0_LACSI|nr:unnamed protein product [Lactuca saligna]